MSDDKKVLLEKVREFETRTGHTVDSFPGDPNNTASVLGERRHRSECGERVLSRKRHDRSPMQRGHSGPYRQRSRRATNRARR